MLVAGRADNCAASVVMCLVVFVEERETRLCYGCTGLHLLVRRDLAMFLCHRRSYSRTERRCFEEMGGKKRRVDNTGIPNPHT